jgi:hypothetical protein
MPFNAEYSIVTAYIFRPIIVNDFAAFIVRSLIPFFTFEVSALKLLKPITYAEHNTVNNRHSAIITTAQL